MFKHIALALPCLIAATAASTSATAAESELDQLRAEVKRMQVKLDAMEDATTESGLAGLKISGMLDPTYIASRNRRSAGFNFLNNFDAIDRGAAAQDSSYAFDNSFFGMAMLQIDKEMEGGTKWRLQLVPHKSASSTFNLGSVIHEATVSVPLAEQDVKLVAGQFADFTGYEYFLSHQTRLVTHNLLFDFTQPSYYTGAGMEFTRGKWTTKALLANMNKSSHADHARNPIVVFRTDYAHSEFAGIGVTGQFGKYLDQGLRMLSADVFYTRGALSVNGQVNLGHWSGMAFNGGDARWAGVSVLGAYQLSPRLELIARADYLKNDKNGGGTLGTIFTGCMDATGLPVGCSDGAVASLGAGDYRNGFGPAEAALLAAAAAGSPGQVRGTNRSALTLGGGYAINANTRLKFEYRHDWADQAVLLAQKAALYRKNNALLATSLVVTF